MPPRTWFIRPALLIGGIATMAAGVVVAVLPMASASTTTPKAATLPPAVRPVPPAQTTTLTRYVAPGASIQNAINEVAEAGGGTVELASGTHSITTPIALRSKVTLTGQASTGTGLTTIRNAIGTDMTIMLDGRAGGLSDVVVTKLKVDCALTEAQRAYTVDPNRNYGVYVTDTSAANDRIMLDSLQITSCAVGFHATGTADLTVRNSNIHDNGGLAKRFHNVSLNRVSRALLANSTFTASTSGNGLDVVGSSNISVEDVTASGNAFRGIRIAASSHVDILTCLATNNADAGILMGSEAGGIRRFRIHSSTSTGNRIGIAASSDSSDGEVLGNTATNNAVDLDISSTSTAIR